ncbi:MAG: SEC-C metal-binding domain-containing protein, partial [Armatimonadota bacterium]
PLIISGQATSEGLSKSDYLRNIDRLVSQMIREHPDYLQQQQEQQQQHEEQEIEGYYVLDEKQHSASLSEAGMIWFEEQLDMKDSSLVDPENLEIAQLIENALKAHLLYQRDDEYVVQDGQVILVDELTGHLQPGRRLSDGLHQAIEAKEGVHMPKERQTVASITYQNFFRLYDKLAGMTGTAKTEEGEFVNVYGMRVVVVPTNMPVIREDHPDVIHKTAEAKYRSIINEIIYMHVREQPVLVGTRSVEVSELVAKRLDGNLLRTHALTQVLLWKLRDYEGIDQETKEQWYAHLRQPVRDLVGQAEHLKRRSNDDEVHLGDIVSELGVDEDILADENIECMMAITGLAEEAEDDETHQRYFGRLRQMLNDGMQPGGDGELSDLNILNAKRHEAEGEIIAEAGRPGMVTVATNMAGRGVNIVLGGQNPDPDERRIPEQFERVKELGGLHVLGTERHESRRIDNQLRGRSGRQGEPGSSRFHVSLEDELMRLFGPDRFGRFLNAWPDEDPVAHGMISKSLERAQRKIEMRNQGIRKNTLKYDNVMNRQRSVIYEHRRRVLAGENVHPVIERMIERTARGVIESYAPETIPEDQWNLEELYQRLCRTVGTPPDENKHSKTTTPLNGLALRLAEADLQDIVVRGDDLTEYLTGISEECTELNRSMDEERARMVRRQKVETRIEELVNAYADPQKPEEDWLLIDLARDVGREFEGTLDIMGFNGLLNIPPNELDDRLVETVLAAYQDREWTRMDTTIINEVTKRCPQHESPDRWDIPVLEAALFTWMHDLRPRLAIDRLQSVHAGEEATRWLRARILAAAEEIKEMPEKIKTERNGIGEGAPGTIVNAPEPDQQAVIERVQSLAAEYGDSSEDFGEWDKPELVYALREDYPQFAAVLATEQLETICMEADNPAEALRDYVRQEPPEGAGAIGSRLFRHWERSWLLDAVDESWMEHLRVIDEIREGIHLRGHAQRDPLVEYQREASQAFERLLDVIARGATQSAFSKTETIENAGAQIRQIEATQQALYSTGADGEGDGEGAGDPHQPATTFVAEEEPGRNDPCPCGSGQKYKRCCGRNK